MRETTVLQPTDSRGAHARPPLPDPAQPSAWVLIRREGHVFTDPTRHARPEVAR
jgi:hypothetical protein